ncbi:MAG: serine/threonine protein kinase [Myxococcaceae bacterium]|nr:serine/threonine protein kinase [Myxococcaceae bacterium]
MYRLGAGGMAEVFKCRLSGIGGFNKLVVVKRIKPDLMSEPGFVEMFLDEARIAANLQHPNIVQLFEIDEAQGLPYIAMEYVRGPTLALINREQRKRGAPLKYGALARLMAGICAGLHCAHRACDERGFPLGIVHRDVSPQNIIVSMEGMPKLLDFGIAKARGQLSHTTVGALKGKLKFMAPEQFVPGARVGPGVDVFAAGVCLYEAATLQLPYSGEVELEVMRAAAAGKFARPSELVPGIDSRLEELILWAMAPNPANRCPDAHALQLALEDYADREGCGETEVARHVAELFPMATAESQLKQAYVDIESDDIIGPIDAASMVRHTLAMRATAVPAAELQVPPRPESRAPVWGAMLALAAIAVFAFTVAFSQQHRTVVVLPPQPQPVALPTVPDSGPVVVAAVQLPPPEPEVPDVAEEDDAEPAAAAAPMREPHAVRRRSIPTKGTLSIDTDPLAQVTVNGKALGWSPIEKLVLAPGAYLVRATHAKRQQVEREVRIVAGRETVVALVLPELPKAKSAPKVVEPPAPKAAEPAPEPVVAAAPEPEPAPPPPSPVVEAPLKRVPAVAPPAPPPAPAPASNQPPSFAHQLECPEEAHLVRGSTHELWCEANGEREGPYLRLWPNGRKAIVGEYRRGKKHGRWLELYEGGGERSRVEWRRGVQMW